MMQEEFEQRALKNGAHIAQTVYLQIEEWYAKDGDNSNDKNVWIAQNFGFGLTFREFAVRFAMHLMFRDAATTRTLYAEWRGMTKQLQTYFVCGKLATLFACGGWGAEAVTIEKVAEDVVAQVSFLFPKNDE